MIARADGTPLYNFAVVIDDLDAGITHVVRGDDHYSNTPKQLLCSRRWGAAAALRARARCSTGPTARSSPSATAPPPCRSCATGATCPRRCATTSRCSAGATGRPGDLHTEKLKRAFSLERVSKSSAVFDEKKLRWMNGRYLRELPRRRARPRRLEELTGRSGLRDAVEISQEKISTLAEFWPLAGFFFDGPADDPKAREKVLGTPEARRCCRGARARWPRSRAVDREALEAALRGRARAPRGVKPKQVFQPMRVALAGTTVSPGIFETVALLGREETISADGRGRSTGSLPAADTG